MHILMCAFVIHLSFFTAVTSFILLELSEQQGCAVLASSGLGL